jgi:hypothetical protein
VVVGPDLAIAKRTPEAAEDPLPVLEEEEEEDDGGRHVGGDEEGEKEFVVLVDVPAEQPRQDHSVTEARDRERLGGSLEQAKDHRLKVGDRVHEVPQLSGSRGRTGLEPGEYEGANSKHECEQRVLAVVMSGSRLVTGEERWQRAGWLGQVDHPDHDQHDAREDCRKDELSVLGHRLPKHYSGPG